jgi:hypothetical protein
MLPSMAAHHHRRPQGVGVESMNMFLDWDRSQPFKVIRGGCECAI